MSSRRLVLASAAVLSVALLITGCSSSGGDAKNGASAGKSAQGATASGVTATANPAKGVNDRVIGEQKSAVHSRLGDTPANGSMTVILRDVEIEGKAMQVRWAYRWDDDSAPDTAKADVGELGVDTMGTAVDTVHLVAYRPLCTDGNWKPGAPSIYCENSALVSPNSEHDTTADTLNHLTVEGTTLMPAPASDAVLDITPLAGYPAFSGIKLKATGAHQ